MAWVSASIGAAVSLTTLHLVLPGFQRHAGARPFIVVAGLVAAPLLGAAIGSAILRLFIRFTGLKRDAE